MFSVEVEGEEGSEAVRNVRRANKTLATSGLQTMGLSVRCVFWADQQISGQLSKLIVTDVIADRKKIDVRMQTSENLKKQFVPCDQRHYLGLSEEFLKMLR